MLGEKLRELIVEDDPQNFAGSFLRRKIVEEGLEVDVGCGKGF
jgi:hypothetical protein